MSTRYWDGSEPGSAAPFHADLGGLWGEVNVGAIRFANQFSKRTPIRFSLRQTTRQWR
jgi:hypothetical protein